MANNRITVESEQCKGCLLCASVCPKLILEADKTKVNSKGYNPAFCKDQAACTACAMCAVICPDSAIKVERDVI